MKKVFVMIALAATVAACNNGTDGGATSDDSATLSTPTTVDSATITPMDSSAVAPMTDTTTAGTSSANSSTSGLGQTGAGTSKAADSAK